MVKRLRMIGCAHCPSGWTLKIIKENQILHAVHNRECLLFGEDTDGEVEADLQVAGSNLAKK